MSENKRGPWSGEERTFIEDNIGKLTPKQMAEQLRRDEAAIERYIKDNLYGGQYKIARRAEKELQGTIVWKDIQKQFTEEEQGMFLYHWGRIVSQFKDDVFPTEEMQIIDTIKLDILMNRILHTQHETEKSIRELETQMASEIDMDKISNLNRQLGILRGAFASMDDTYRELLKQKGSILTAMKATRDARIKNVENSRQNFTSWMRQLIEDKELRKSLGLEMEKMRIATNLELARLSQYHQYEDKTLDRPILNSETVKDD